MLVKIQNEPTMLKNQSAQMFVLLATTHVYRIPFVRDVVPMAIAS